MRSVLNAAIWLAVLIATSPALAADLKDEGLGAHNALRAQHGVPALSWSASLAKSAQAVADQCSFEHSATSNGENLAQGTSGGYSPAQFVNDWYSEISSYDFAGGTSTGGDIGHFTQVIWKSTTKVGCGLAQCSGNDLLVCQYSPAGNLDGAYLDNVPPAK